MPRLLHYTHTHTSTYTRSNHHSLHSSSTHIPVINSIPTHPHPPHHRCSLSLSLSLSFFLSCTKWMPGVFKCSKWSLVSLWNVTQRQVEKGEKERKRQEEKEKRRGPKVKEQSFASATRRRVTVRKVSLIWIKRKLRVKNHPCFVLQYQSSVESENESDYSRGKKYRDLTFFWFISAQVSFFLFLFLSLLFIPFVCQLKWG